MFESIAFFFILKHKKHPTMYRISSETNFSDNKFYWKTTCVLQLNGGVISPEQNFQSIDFIVVKLGRGMYTDENRFYSKLIKELT